MESSQLFSLFVLTMCAVHAVWTASASLNTWWNKNVSRPKQQVGAVRNTDGPLREAQAPQRSDWYAFFHCSDLVGKDPAPGKAPADTRNERVPDRKNSRMGRITA